ncbi:hypothetical protein [Roseiarcus sp.]|uniref:hypothetical protein n=1 Tax=Roseiarcus sp. TaxID=1969460 RepID=UPI003F9AB6FC
MGGVDNPPRCGRRLHLARRMDSVAAGACAFDAGVKGVAGAPYALAMMRLSA